MATKVFTFVFAIVGLTLLFACSVQPVHEEHAAEAKVPEFAKALPEGCRLGPVARVDGAEIYAVLDPSAPSQTEFVTLDEAMALKLCTVKEAGEGGTVNTLKISNSGAKPIFCMAGDLVLGGQQDRILAESLVVAPETNDQDIPVFCVEHGRWQTQDKDGEFAQKRSFNNSEECGQVDLNVKKAALDTRDQSAVWEQVALNNLKVGVSGKTTSGTFRATFDDEATHTKIEKNFAAAKTLVGKTVVGFAVACDNELVAMDVFESTALCAKLSNKLLRSYVITGISGGYTSSEATAQGQDNLPLLGDLPVIGELFRRQSRSRRTPLSREDLTVMSQLTETKVTVQCQETTLSDVVKSIAEQSEVKIFLGHTEAAQNLVTLDQTGVTLQYALNQVCDGAHLSWHIQDGGIVIVAVEPATQTTGGDYVESDEPQTGQPRMRLHLSGDIALPLAPVAVMPNANTETRREYTKESVKYDCKDTKSGKVVQRSFLKR